MSTWTFKRYNIATVQRDNRLRLIVTGTILSSRVEADSPENAVDQWKKEFPSVFGYPPLLIGPDNTIYDVYDDLKIIDKIQDSISCTRMMVEPIFELQ